jgi:cysteine desulfurase
VLRALGLSDADANTGIRIGLGRFTTSAEVDFAIDALATTATRLAAERVMAGQGAHPYRN